MEAIAARRRARGTLRAWAVEAGRAGDAARRAMRKAACFQSARRGLALAATLAAWKYATQARVKNPRPFTPKPKPYT